MNNIDLIILIAFILVMLWVASNNNNTVNKYLKYTLIILFVFVVIILKYIFKKDKDIFKKDNLQKELDKAKEDIEEVNMEYTIKVTAEKTKNEEMMKQLEEVKKIKDKNERRKRLASLIG
jgi:Ca2+/Na+ antiporter